MVTAFCQAGNSSTRVCTSQTVFSGALMRVSVRWCNWAAGSMPLPSQVTESVEATLPDGAGGPGDRYMLIYGTPVPGYHAPDDVTAISDEILAVLLEVCARESDDEPKTPFDVVLGMNRGWAGALPASSPTVHRALSFWTRVQGVLSLELAGHLTPLGFDPELFLAEEVAEL